jgi:hypothetical protein
MPIPQVTDRIKEAPALALRALFAGVGQLLLAADKVRTRAVDQLAQFERSRPGRAQAPAASGSTTTPSSPKAPAPTAPSASAGPAAPASAGPAAPASAGPTAPAPAPGTAEQASDASLAGAGAGAEPEAAPGGDRTPGPGGKPAAAKRPPTKPRAAAKPAGGKRPGTKPRASGKPAPTALPATKPPATAQPASKAPPIPNYDDLSVASLRARLRVLDAGTLRAMIGYEKAHANREAVITMFERRLAKMGGEES